jgi:hypothetical protein
MGKQKEVVVVKTKEGCFLQTLNFGCITIFIIVVIAIIFGILGVVG